MNAGHQNTSRACPATPGMRGFFFHPRRAPARHSRHTSPKPEDRQTGPPLQKRMPPRPHDAFLPRGIAQRTLQEVLEYLPQSTIRRSASHSLGFCMHGHAGIPQRNKTWALKGGLDIHTKIRYARSAITFLGPLSCLFRTTTVQRPSQWYATLRVWSPTLTIYSPFTGKRNIKSPVKRSFTKNIRPSAP